MEVDLVICFDANISPLRMIQRMGRTGRKHDGRVDILVTQSFLCFFPCNANLNDNSVLAVSFVLLHC